MTRLSISFILLVTAIGVSSFAARADEKTDNLARIKSMTREERARVLKKLDAFDSMDSAEQKRIREFNSHLDELDPEAKARSYAAMRRYHVFYQSLPVDKRKLLDSKTDPSEKLSLIETYRAELKKPARRPMADAIQISTLSPVRLRSLARHLIVYFSLDPVKDAKELNEFAKIKNELEREKKLNSLIQSKGLRDRRELREKLREEREEFLAVEETVKQNPILAKRLQQAQTEIEKDTDNPKTPAKKGAIRPKDLSAMVKDSRTRYLINLLDEQQVFKELEASKVDPSRLELFEEALPPWAMESFDELPPDAARKRLKVLYRLVFPGDEEMQPRKALPAATPKVKPMIQPKEGQGSPF